MRLRLAALIAGALPACTGWIYGQPINCRSCRPEPDAIRCCDRVWSLSLRQWGSVCSVSLNNQDAPLQLEEANQLEVLFSQRCDNDGFISKSQVISLPPIAELLESGDLLLKEFDEIWENVVKAQDMGSKDVQGNRIDMDSFMLLYRNIDDLFEDFDDDSSADEADSPSKDAYKEESIDEEIASIFTTLCDGEKLVSKDVMRRWDEVANLLDEGLLGEEEFDELWETVPKSPQSPNRLDLDGFLNFNLALDGLFDVGEDEMDAMSDEDSPYADSSDRSTVLFESLSNMDGLVGKAELRQWAELQAMLLDGDILQSEVDTLFDKAKLSSTHPYQLDQQAFATLVRLIDDLFEDSDEEEDEVAQSGSVAPTKSEPELARDMGGIKSQLLALLDEINRSEEGLPCGLETSEVGQREVMELVTSLEAETTNFVRSRKGNTKASDIAGSWDLLYSSSGAMKFNKGLTGLGGSFPGGKFGGLKQILKASKFLNDAEYVEHIEVNPSPASFDVKVTGDWDLRQSVSLFTGEPSLVLTVVPDKVNYGPTSTRADHWKSLGAMNMLDVTYLDEDLRIMRGNTAVDTVFILRRSTE